jgi:hypothetical protein
MTWPAYLCLGRHMWVQGRLRRSPGRHITSPAGIHIFWPEFTFLGRIMSKPALPWPASADLGPTQQSRPAWARTVEAWYRPGRRHPGGPASPSSRPAHPGLPEAAPEGHVVLRTWAAPRPGRRFFFRVGHAQVPATAGLWPQYRSGSTGQASLPAGPYHGRPIRPGLGSPWAAPCLAALAPPVGQVAGGQAMPASVLAALA